MKKLFITILLILFASPVYAGEWSWCAWSYEDKVLEASWQILNVADIYVTDKAIEQGGKELNPVIGSHPSDDELVAWGIGFAVLHYFVTGYLQDKNPTIKKYWLWGSNIVKAGAVGYNITVVEW